MQETFLRAYRSWHQYTLGTRCKSWLFAIARNQYLRSAARRSRFEEILAAHAAVDDVDEGAVEPLWRSVDSADPEGRLFDDLVDASVLEALDDLPEEFRTAIVLSDIEGLRYDEIAELMEIPVGTVKSRLYRGRRRLQEALYEYAVETGRIDPRGAGRVSGRGGGGNVDG